MRTANMLATVMSLALAIGGSLAYCPAGYNDLGTGCYHFGEKEVHSWQQAFFTCHLELNGYLVEIESQHEHDNIVAYIKAVADPEGAYGYWLGATDTVKPDEFRWMTSGHYMNFTAWGSGEPSNAGGIEECVGLSAPIYYLWGDLDCNNRSPYMGIPKALCETDRIG